MSRCTRVAFLKTLDSECALKGHMASSFDRPISLALSGGGIRAMAYHLGVLKWLAERGLFEQVKRISTVSGGSLLMGLIYKSADFKWPSSNYFLDKTWSSVTDQLCSRNLQLGAFGQLASIANWRFLFSSANLLALELTESWGLDVPLADLPYGPEWSINGTTAENGKRCGCEERQVSIGDWLRPKVRGEPRGAWDAPRKRGAHDEETDRRGHGQNQADNRVDVPMRP